MRPIQLHLSVHPLSLLAGALLVGTLGFLMSMQKTVLNKAQFLTPKEKEILSCMSLVNVHNDKTLVFEGINVQIVNGLGATNGYPPDPHEVDPLVTQVNGVGNLIVGYNELGNPNGDDRSGSHNIVFGHGSSYSSFGGIVGPYDCTTSGPFASVTGGRLNRASGLFASVSGGAGNTADAEYNVFGTALGSSSVSGGVGNTASGFWSSVSGGHNNTASGNSCSVSGGAYNIATGWSTPSGTGSEIGAASVSGGAHNIADSDAASVGGGYLNTAGAEFASVSGGGGNTAIGCWSSVSGGSDNAAYGFFSSVSGGSGRSANTHFSWAAGSLTEQN